MTNKLQLHDYQVRAVEFAIDKPQNYQALDVGLGKTAITLHVIKYTQQRALVFGPLRTIYSSWPAEIAKWTPELSWKILHGKTRDLSDIDRYDILLINYEGLMWLAQQKCKWHRRMVIYDEASMVKAHNTKRFAHLKKMDPLWTGQRMCLSATPAPNKLTELWSQYYLLDKGKRLGKNISAFRNEYCSSFSYPGMSVTVYDVRPDKVKPLYDAIAPITLRLSNEEYLQLPDIVYNEIPVVLPAKCRAQYRELEETFFLELEDGAAEAFNTATLGMKLRQFVQGGLYDDMRNWMFVHDEKLGALEDLMQALQGKPLLCMIQFRGELELIRKRYPIAPVIAGGTKAHEANAYIEAWNRGELELLLCHPASISHGVNLQYGGCNVLWFGLTWSLEQYIQLNGRLHRQGQTEKVFIHHLVMQDTIDEAVMAALKSKDHNQKTLLRYLNEYRHA